VAGDVPHARYLFEFGPRQPGRSILVRVEAADRLAPFALDGIDLRGDLVLGDRHAEPDPLQQWQPSVSLGYQRPSTTHLLRIPVSTGMFFEQLIFVCRQFVGESAKFSR